MKIENESYSTFSHAFAIFAYQMVGNDVISRVAVFDDVESDKELPIGAGAGHFADGFVVFVEDFALDGADDALAVLALGTVSEFVSFGPFHDQFIRKFTFFLLDKGLNLTLVAVFVESVDGKRSDGLFAVKRDGKLFQFHFSARRENVTFGFVAGEEKESFDLPVEIGVGSANVHPIALLERDLVPLDSLEDGPRLHLAFGLILPHDFVDEIHELDLFVVFLVTHL